MTIQKEKNIEEYNKSPKKCKYCGKDLSYEQRKNIFCCSSCAAKYNNLYRKPRTYESRLKTSNSLLMYHNSNKVSNLVRENQICLNCGKEINSRISTRKFCSSKCCGEYKHKQLVELKSSYLREWLVNPDKFSNGYSYNFIKEYLMDKYNNSCQICGWSQVNKYTGYIPLQLHHIDGNCTNNRPENLQLLCPNCHSLTENFGSRNLGNSRRYKLKEWYKNMREMDPSSSD